MKNWRFLSRWPVAAGVITIVAVGEFALAQGAPHPALTPGPRILVIDNHAIMTESKLGLDIRRQVVAYEDNMTAEFGAEAQALQKETDALQKQSAASPPNVRAKKAQALQAREDAYQQKVGARQKLIQGGEMVARQRYLTEVGMLVHAIMLERGADMVIVKSSVADSVDGLNITQTVIHRLDQKIPSLKVTLVAPPPTSSIQIH